MQYICGMSVPVKHNEVTIRCILRIVSIQIIIYSCGSCIDISAQFFMNYL